MSAPRTPSPDSTAQPDDWFPPHWMGFAGRVGATFEIDRPRDVGAENVRFVHWKHANREVLHAAARVYRLGTWRRAWVDVLMEMFGPQLNAGLTLGQIAKRNST